MIALLTVDKCWNYLQFDFNIGCALKLIMTKNRKHTYISAELKLKRLLQFTSTYTLYKFRKSCDVLKSTKVERHPVGICTVERSSPDSSYDVPMKSKERQLRVRRRTAASSSHCR